MDTEQDIYDLKISLERSDADALNAMAELVEVSPTYLLERCKLMDVLGFAYGDTDEPHKFLASLRQDDLEKAKRVCDRVKEFYPDGDLLVVNALHDIEYWTDRLYTVVVDDDGHYGRNSSDVVYVSEVTNFKPFLVRGADKSTDCVTIKQDNKYFFRTLESWKEATSLDVVGLAVHSFSITDIKNCYNYDNDKPFVQLILPLLSWSSEQDAIDAGQKLDLIYYNHFVFYRYQDSKRHKLAFKSENAFYIGKMTLAEVKPKPLPIKEPSAFERICRWLNRRSSAY